MKRRLWLLPVLVAGMISISGLNARTILQYIPFLDVHQLRNINWNGSSAPRDFIDCAGVTFFSAKDNTHGIELWKTDGTEAGTVMVKDIHPDGNGLSYLGTEFVCFKNRLYFNGYDNEHGGELYVSDGTPNGTYMLREIAHGSWSSSYASRFYNHKNELLYFRASTAKHGYEPWVTNGTYSGTRMLRDIRSNEGAGTYAKSSWPEHFIAYEDTVYFTARDSEENYELWSSDGSTIGTQKFMEINPLGGASIGQMITFNNRLYFPASNGVDGLELWSSDGSPAGTAMVQDINPGANGSGPNKFIKFRASKAGAQEYLYFTAYTPENGQELWRTNGETEGTSLFQDLNDSGNSMPDNFIKCGNYLYFTATNPQNGRELWRSNGSTPGALVEDINPGPADGISFDADQRYFAAFGSELIFTADDGATGREIWRSKGGIKSTYRLRDINPGAAHSNPQHFFASGQNLYFSTYNNQGFEPWVYYKPTLPLVFDLKSKGD